MNRPRRWLIPTIRVLDCEGSEKLAKWLCDRSEGALVAGAFLNSGKWH